MTSTAGATASTAETMSANGSVAWRVRYFDPAEPDAIDMWRGPTNRCASQPQVPGLGR